MKYISAPILFILIMIGAILIVVSILIANLMEYISDWRGYEHKRSDDA